MRVYRAGMTAKITKKTQELNTALLKVIEKDILIERLSKQLESKPHTLTSFSLFH
jgi:CTP:phosphocholine cytidylyltransferase-like protein